LEHKEIRVTVFSHDEHMGRYDFSFVVREITNLQELNLSHAEFYLTWGKVALEFPHYEIEIKREVADFYANKGLHITLSPAEESFVCYPLRIATLTEAQQIIKTWCLGSVMKMEFDIDLNTIFSECKGDHDLLERIIFERHGFKVTLCD